jgi:hypothetical protein
MKSIRWDACIVTAVLVASCAPAFAQRLADAPVGRLAGEVAAYDPPRSNLTQIIDQLARATAVPIGFEAAAEPSPQGRAPGPDEPSPSKRIPLTGLTLGAALTELMRLYPGYEWSEATGIINVRPKGAASDPADPLNRPVPSFRVRDVNLGGAAVAIQQLFDAEWQPPADSTWLNPAAPLSAAPAGVADWRGRTFSVSLERPLVLQVLNAVAVAHGSVGWRVDFTGPRVTWGDARLLFIGLLPGQTTLLTSARASAVPRSRSPADLVPRVVLELPPTPSRLAAVFRALARAGVVRVGLELLPESVMARPGAVPAGEWQADLTGLSGDAAIDRILGLAPQYERVDENGVINIVPRGSRSNGGEILNRRVKTFDVKNAMIVGLPGPLRAAVTGLPASPAAGPLLRPPPPARPVNPAIPEAARRQMEEQDRLRDAEWTRTTTLSLRNVTLRQVLNALMTERDDLTWTVAFTGDNASAPALQIELAGRWTGATLTLPAGRW